MEEDNNPIRAIFAIVKLNEGWDVLKLCDIERISEETISTKTTTNSEAQLIGRGSCYYSFEYKEARSYTRGFELVQMDLKIIETLHYHSINESAHIKNLEKSLESAIILLEIKFLSDDKDKKTEFRTDFKNNLL